MNFPEKFVLAFFAAIISILSLSTQSYCFDTYWTRYIGGVTDYTYGIDVAVGSDGYVYVAGYTYEDIYGTNAGGSDLLVAKYDSAGNNIWTRQIGGADDEFPSGVAVDGSGNVFVTGYTYGNFDGWTSAGNEDALLVKYDTNGNKLWSRQLGTANYDISRSVAVDSGGNAYITGSLDAPYASTGKFFTAKYDSAGNWKWTDQLVSSGWGTAITVDGSDNIYATGLIKGSVDGQPYAGGSDTIVVKYNTSGSRTLTRLIGSPDFDKGMDIVVDGGGNILVAGETYGDLDGNTNAGNQDAFITKYDSAGTKLWTGLFGCANYEYLYGMSLDSYENVYMVGSGNVGCFDPYKEPSYYSNTFLVKYDTSGVRQWMGSVATESGADANKGISVSGNIDAYLIGTSSYSLMLVKLDLLPPISTLTIPESSITYISSTTYTITGTAADNTGSGISRVEVSTDGGNTWSLATGTESWSYEWHIPAPGDYYITTRATDALGHVEAPGTWCNISVSGFAGEDDEHLWWDQSFMSAGCDVCHTFPPPEPGSETFLPAYFPQLHEQTNELCGSCHSPASVSHEDAVAAGHGHSVMVNVTSGGAVTPTYDYGKLNYYLLDGDKIGCVTCHNTMDKYEDFGRVWEWTTTSDNQTYSLENGPWLYAGDGPAVYRDTVLWSGPFEHKSREDYRVPPDEYTYDETAGTITFGTAQAQTAYIYVTLHYPYLRISNAVNWLCSDCHTDQTHMGANCLVCHQTHNSDNIQDVRETVRTTDRSERPVVFLGFSGVNSFADGDTVYDGICEVCHTTTKYHTRDGSGFANHSGGVNMAGTDCTSCHTHLSGFAK